MSVAFLFGPSGANEDMEGTRAFYRDSANVRGMFAEAAARSAFDVDVLLRHRDPEDGDVSLMRVNGVSIAAGMLGMYDDLREAGIRPGVVGGISLGGLVSACVAGSMSRGRLFQVLMANDHRPASANPTRKEGIAFVLVPAGDDPSRYYGLRERGVFVAADFGMVASGEGRMLMLSGYRRALEWLAATDRNRVRVREEHLTCAAYHSPLREHARAALERHPAIVDIINPRTPVCSAIDGSTLRTADGIRDLFLRNNVAPLDVPSLIREIAAHEPDIGVAVGPSMRPGLFSFPFPVVHVAAPGDVREAVRAVRSAGRRRETRASKESAA